MASIVSITVMAGQTKHCGTMNFMTVSSAGRQALDARVTLLVMLIPVQDDALHGYI